MKVNDVSKLCREMFSSEPVIMQIEATFLSGKDDGQYVDFCFIIDGDLYEAESKVIPRIIDLMGRMADTPVEFVILPSSANYHSDGTLVYSRDS